MNVQTKKSTKIDELTINKGEMGNVIGHHFNEKHEHRYVVRWQNSGIPLLAIPIQDVEIINENKKNENKN